VLNRELGTDVEDNISPNMALVIARRRAWHGIPTVEPRPTFQIHIYFLGLVSQSGAIRSEAGESTVTCAWCQYARAQHA